MDDVRVGIIGLGNMGRVHAGYVGALKGARLVAVCDRSAEAVGRYTSGEYDGVLGFSEPEALIASDAVDAVMVVVPHFAHRALCEAAFAAGKHVLCEKPLSVTALDAAAVVDAHEAAQRTTPGLVFSMMLNQRMNPRYRAVKRLIKDGTLGAVRRVSWTITNWFRTQAYFDSGGWRATWRGEGGGVLVNQCPHNLDLLCWFVGSPTRVTSLIKLGGYHDIEVEDEVLALMEFEGGAVGTFATGTGEAPGVNRLEIAGDGGLVVVDDRPGVQLVRNVVGTAEHTAESDEAFAMPESERITIEPTGEDPQHRGVTQNWVDAIRGEAALVAPGSDGLRSVELANAMLLSGLEGVPVSIPMDRAAYAKKLAELQANSTRGEKVVREVKADMGGSF